MPAPNLLNPKCPQCDRPMANNGAKLSGCQEYRCRRCKKTVVDSDRQRGGQTIGDQPMTPYERELGCKESNPNEYKSAQKRKKQTKNNPATPEQIKSIEQMKGLLKTDHPAPTDAEVEAMLEQHRKDKYLAN